ncbi:MAG: SdrD B-like domain-containing protein, partial [Chloroflexales bacterium]
MASNRWPSRPARRTAAHLAARPLAHAVLTLFASLLLILGAAPLALLGPVTTVHAQGGGSLTIKVYKDVGRDGVDSSGTEPGISGVSVSLYTSDNLQARLSTTAASGVVPFTDLPDGDYRIEVSLLPDYAVSVPGNDTNPGLVSFVTISGGSATPVHVGLRQLTSGVDSGHLVPPESGAPSGKRNITTRVWDDADSNGIQDAGEPGLPDVSLELVTSSYGHVATSVPVTGTLGRYTFGDVPSDQSYYIHVLSATTGYTFTIRDLTAGSRNSDMSLGTGLAFVPTGLTGANIDSVDIGFTRASVSGFVWRDVNTDGISDPAETRTDGVVVELVNSSGTPVFTTTTHIEFNPADPLNSLHGVFKFPGVATGTYSVRIPSSQFSAGAVLGGAATPSNPPSGDDIGLLNGNVISPTGVPDATVGDYVESAPFTLDFSNVVGGSNRKSDALFGFYKGSVGDLVWFDVNRDDNPTGENGQNGLTLFVDDGRGGGIANDGIRNGTELVATTGDNLSTGPGYYLFDDLPLGITYTIVISPDNFLSGATLDGVAVGNAIKATNSLSQTYYYTTTPTLTVTNPNHFAADFGLTWTDIGNFVFEDVNGSGAYEAGDNPIPGATVELYRAGGGAPVLTATTDITGNYILPNQPSGGYYAVFDLSTAVPTYTNYIASPKVFTATVDPANAVGDYTDLITSSISSGRWRTPVFTPTAGIVNNGVDAGFYLPATVSGRAFFDTNNDGHDALTPEPGMRGVTVNLHRADALTVVLSTTTTALSDTGAYTFTGVVPGAYVIDFVNPVSDTFALITGTTNVSTTGGVYNSDVVTVTGTVGNTGPVDVTSGTPVKYLDAGFQGRGDVSGRVFLDKNGSDTQDLPDDTNLDNATAALTVTANLPNLVVTYPITPVTTIGSATTNYSFPFLPFGTGVTYTLDFTPPAETPTYMPSAANAVVTDTVDSDGPSLVITQTAATTASQVFDQGYYQNAQVTARVFEEKTGTVNNQYNVGDTGINGVTVTLDLLVAGTAVQTQTTDTTGTGLVTFTVKPGSYRLNIAETASPLTGLVTSPGWTDPVTVTTVLGNGQLFSGDTSATDGLGANSFGYYTPATITGTVFFDRNLNQLKANEPGVAGVGVTLQQGASVVSTTTTTVTGIYTFSGLLPGNYTATFTNPDTGNFAFITGGDSDVT